MYLDTPAANYDFDGAKLEKSSFATPFGVATNVAIYNNPSIAKFGSYYFETNVAIAGDSHYQDYIVSPGVGEEYTYSIYVRSPGGTPVSGRFVLWGMGSAGGNEASEYRFTVSSTQWQRISTTYKVSRSGVNRLRAQMYLDTPAANYDFDGAKLEKNSYASSYDGQMNYFSYNNADIAVFGSRYLETNVPNPGDSWYQDYSVKANVGDTYTYSIYVRSPTGVPVSGRLALWGLGSVNENSNIPFTVSSKDWQRITTTYTVTRSGVNTLRAQMYLDTTGVNYDFDGAQLEESTSATPFADGSYGNTKLRDISYVTITDPEGNEPVGENHPEDHNKHPANHQTVYYLNSEGLVTKMGEPLGPTRIKDGQKPDFPENPSIQTTVKNEIEVFYDCFDEWLVKFLDSNTDITDEELDAIFDNDQLCSETNVSLENYEVWDDAWAPNIIEGNIPPPELSQPMKAGSIMYFKYDGEYNLTKVINKDETFTTYKYDSRGNRAEETNHDHTDVEKNYKTDSTSYKLKHRTSSYLYDQNNNLLSEKSPIGKTTTFTYDIKGNPLTETDAEKNVISYTYDDFGNQVTKIDPKGNTTTNLYDANGNLISTKGPLTNNNDGSTYQKVAYYEYDQLGNKLSERTEGLGATKYIYDAMGRLLTQRSPSNEQGLYSLSKYIYDAAGRKVKDEVHELKQGQELDDAWYDESWLKRAPITIDNSTNSTALVDHQVKITIPFRPGIKADYSDLRFTGSDEVTEISHWLEDYAPSSSATVWVKIPQISANSAETIYVYYDNPNASSASDGSAVFDFFDDFDTFDNTKWSATGAYLNNDSKLTITTGSVYSNNPVVTSSINKVFEGNVRWLSADSSWSGISQSEYTSILGNGNNAFIRNTAYRQWVHALASDGNSSTYNLGIAYLWTNFLNTDYVIGQSIDSSAIKIYKDGVQVYSFSGSYDKPQYAILGAFDGSKSGSNNIPDIEVDWYRVRKNTTIEPTAVMGSSTSVPENTLKSYVDYEYNESGQLNSQTDQTGAVSSYEYDANGNKIKEINPLGGETTYTYDALNRTTKEIQPDGNWVAYQYDSFGNVIKEGTPEGTNENFYDMAGNEVANTSLDGSATKTIYDKEGNERTTGDGLNKATASDYDANGNVTKVIDPDAEKTLFEYDKNQNETKVISADNTSMTTVYNETNQVKNEVDQEGQVIKTNYDDAGLEDLLVQPNNQNQDINYDQAGNNTQVNAQGNIVNSADIEATYDAQGNPTTIKTTDSSGTQSQIKTTYENERITRLTDLNRAVNFDYDLVGNLTKLSDLTGDTTYAYDTASKLKSITDLNNKTTIFGYEPKEKIANREYDSPNVTKVTLPNGVQTAYDYDPASKINSLINSKGSDTLSEYQYTYDKNGNIISSTSFNSIKNIFKDDFSTFSSLNWTNNSAKVYADSTNGTIIMQGSEPYWDSTFYGNQIFDRADRPVMQVDFKVDNNDSSLYVSTVGYSNGSFRLFGVRHLGGKLYQAKVGSTGTDNGGAIPISINTWYTAEFEYTPSEAKLYIYPKDGTKPLTPAYTFNVSDWNPRFRFWNYRGTANLDNVSVFSTNTSDNKVYEYDNLNRLTKVKKADGSEVGYTYDAEGNRETMTTPLGTTTYTYRSPFDVTDANELKVVTDPDGSETRYEYDENGNTTKKTEPNGDETNYTYDNQNQLVKVETPAGNTIEYIYDGNGNRYSKKIMKADGTVSERFYQYDADGNIVTEYKKIATGTEVLVRYTRDTSGKAISMKQGSNTYYFIYNAHGDVTSLTDASGDIAVTYDYDEFGRQTNSTGTVYNPLRYSGANNSYYDIETGLYKMGVRYYQSDIGRWLTRDDYEGEQTAPQSQNRYIYTENNPITKADPSGFKSKNVVRKKVIKKMTNFGFSLWGVLYYKKYRGKNFIKIVGVRNCWIVWGMRAYGYYGPTTVTVKNSGKRVYRKRGKQKKYWPGLTTKASSEYFRINKKVKKRKGNKRRTHVIDKIQTGYWHLSSEIMEVRNYKAKEMNYYYPGGRPSNTNRKSFNFWL